MAEKRKKQPQTKKIAMVGSKKTDTEEVRSATRGRVKMKTPVIASVALVLVCAIVVLLVLLLRPREFDYLKSNLSKYITMSAEDYKDYTLGVKLDKVTDSDVERSIMNLLYQNRDSSNKPAEEKTIPVSVGDEAFVYYRGYITDENGIETDFKGGSNMTDSYYKLGIGSLSFVKGFEEGLVGAVPANHIYDPQTDLITEGAVSAGDVIFLSYSVMRPDGTSDVKKSERIDLSRDNIDARYGEGFKEYFETSNIIIGKEISDGKTFSYENGTAVFFDMTVDYAIRCQNPPLTIDAYFPASYHEVSLRGAQVKFDVYFKCTLDYDVPEYNESFITEILEIKPEDLEGYAGESVVEKHRSYLFDKLNRENESEREQLIEEAVWNYYKAKAKIVSLPISEVEKVYEKIYAEIYNEYISLYSNYFSTIESYIIARYGAAENSSPRELMSAEAEEIVTEKLIFYYIIRKENILPSVEEYEKSYKTIYSEHLDYYVERFYKDEFAKLEDEAEKQEKIKETEKEMLEYFGDEYFAELVYYDYAYDKILSFAKVVEK